MRYSLLEANALYAATQVHKSLGHIETLYLTGTEWRDLEIFTGEYLCRSGRSVVIPSIF